MSEDIKNLVSQGKEGQIAAFLMVLHKLGGWTVLAVAAIVALHLIWNARETTNAELLKEIREGRATAYEVIKQNSRTLERVADALEVRNK